MKYYFEGEKIRSATSAEKREIGIEDAEMWTGRLVLPIEAETLAEAWSMAEEKVTDYESKHLNIKVIGLGWCTTDHYGIDAQVEVEL
jgi:hypothetical protein